MRDVAGKAIAVHEALAAAGIPHAIGGALALAYYVANPRGTNDIDVNIFLGTDRIARVLKVLPKQIKVTAENRKLLAGDGQGRLMWDDTPVDLFFAVHDFHFAVGERIARVPFEGHTLPIIAADALIVFKAMFTRTQDWADIENMIVADPEPARTAMEHLRRLVGRDDAAVLRLSALLARDL